VNDAIILLNYVMFSVIIGHTFGHNLISILIEFIHSGIADILKKSDSMNLS
jgi:hypothetical protein